MQTLFPGSSLRRLARPAYRLLARDWTAALSRLAYPVGLAAVISGALGLALVWVFLVPIYQAPDEPLHLDYALAIREHGGLFRLHHVSWNDLPSSVHPYTIYLMEATESRPIIFNSKGKVLPKYGTRAFYATLEENAPSREGLRIDIPNKPFVVYPFGYYGLLALWIAFLQLFNDGPVFTFFAARLLSVLLLGVSLVFVAATARRLHFKPWSSLLLTAAIGFFPLTSFVASSVQPDNLSCTLVSIAFYLAVRAREAPGSTRWVGLLGLTLGALVITKQHFFLCVLLPTAAMLTTRTAGIPQRRRAELAALFLVPALLLGSLHIWLTWGAVSLYGPPAAYTPNVFTYTLQGFKRAFLDYFAGTTHDSFWGVFGWLDTPLIIRGKHTTEAVQLVIHVFSWAILGLTLLRLEQVASRLVRLANRRGRDVALRLACSDPLLNCYFLFTVFMFVIFIRIDNRFGAQGRNWWPLLLPTFLAAVVYAPKALTLRRSRLALSGLVLGGLLLYGAVGSWYALRSIEHRYYSPAGPAATGVSLASDHSAQPG